MHTPGFIIAGASSQCGKTITSMGLMAAFNRRGLNVQGFKVGPDLADPILHTHITGRPSINLDSWMMGPKRLRYVFSKHAADSDLVIIEGVQGLYDGEGMSSIGSTADVAKIINRPIVLILDAKACALSAAAMIKGFCDFDKKVPVKAVILNNINDVDLYSLMKDAIENNTGVDVIGYLPTRETYSFEDKATGLVNDIDSDSVNEKIAELSNQIEDTIDLDELLDVARGWETDTSGNATVQKNIDKHTKDLGLENVRIGVARDKAFCFYYQDNFDLLEDMGAELIYFSPMDDSLPDKLNGLYIGGGYPEIFAHRLEHNKTIRDQIKAFVEAGGPVYAECGGLLYLCDRLMDYNGFGFDMAGVLPVDARMVARQIKMGYVDIEIRRNNIFGLRGTRTRGYKSHFSETGEIDNPDIEMSFKVFKDRETVLRQWMDGYKYKNLLAGFPHIHFYTNMSMIAQFLKNCSEFSK